jgi:DNA-binding NtrC family response regulator
MEIAMSTHAAGANFIDTRDAHLSLERFVEHLTETGCLTLVQWARREAPELLGALMRAFVTGHPATNWRKMDFEASASFAATRGRTAAASATLRDIEREHIRRVLAASKSMHEAAEKLGINDATLWRKRKRYKLD